MTKKAQATPIKPTKSKTNIMQQEGGGKKRVAPCNKWSAKRK